MTRKEKPVLAVSISVICVSLAIGHLVFPNFRLDASTLILIMLAALPWLRTILKSVEFPGGLKIELQDLENIRREAVQAKLLEPTPQEPALRTSMASLAQEDPNLALAALRIEIERRLKAIASASGIGTERESISSLMDRLVSKGIISPKEHSVFRDLVPLLNTAVHGATVTPTAAQWSIDVGPRLLATLDRLAASLPRKK